MRNDSHKTLISQIADYVDGWRKQKGMSQATVVDEIVKAHGSIGGPVTTGITFEGNADEYKRMHANMQRVSRWLDDKTKDNGLLPVNFLPSILAALPADARRSFLNDMLSPLGLMVQGINEAQAGTINATGHLVKMAREGAEAQTALANLVDGATQDELKVADRELSDIEEAARAARAEIRAQLH